MYYTFNQLVYDQNPTQEDLTEDWEYEQIHNMCGEAFHGFLSLCFEYATHFSMSRAPWTMCTDTTLERKLSRFAEGQIKTHKWFGYVFRGEPVMEVHVYRACPETEAMLKEHCRNLFMYYCENYKPRRAPTLEDLCFFRHDTLFVGTVSHEFICAAYPPDTEFERRMLRIGRWDRFEDDGFERVKLSQYYHHRNKERI